MKKTLCFMALLFNVSMIAQTTVSADTTWLSVYNTGKRYLLKAAPFGEQKPKKGIIYSMVIALDSITIKKNENPQSNTPPTFDEIKAKVKDLTPNLNSAPTRITAADIENEKKNAGKRTCEIVVNGLSGKAVLLDFDKGCDPTYKCLQAQQAGALMAIVIFDTDKRDSIAMARGRYADSLRIPCFSITRAQGDSVRRILPSLVTLFTPKVEVSRLERSDILVFNAYKSDEKALLQWQNNTHPDNDYFIVEKSPDGIKYERFKEVEGNGILRNLQTYTLEDPQPYEGDNYYRLLLKRKDGAIVLTEPQLLEFTAIRDFDFYPNPATDELTIRLKKFEGKSLDLIIYDGIGKQIFKEHIEQVSPTPKTISLTQLNLTEGYYTITVIHKGKAMTRRFMFVR